MQGQAHSADAQAERRASQFTPEAGIPGDCEASAAKSETKYSEIVDGTRILQTHFGDEAKHSPLPPYLQQDKGVCKGGAE